MKKNWDKYFSDLYRKIINLFPTCKSKDIMNEDNFIENCHNEMKIAMNNTIGSVYFGSFDNEISNISIRIEFLKHFNGDLGIRTMRYDEPSVSFNDNVKQSGLNDEYDEVNCGICYYYKNLKI